MNKVHSFNWPKRTGYFQRSRREPGASFRILSGPESGNASLNPSSGDYDVDRKVCVCEQQKNK